MPRASPRIDPAWLTKTRRESKAGSKAVSASISCSRVLLTQVLILVAMYGERDMGAIDLETACLRASALSQRTASLISGNEDINRKLGLLGLAKLVVSKVFQ